MPQAAPFNPHDPAEADFVRRFVAKHLASVVGAPVERPEGRKVLVDTASGEVYNLAASLRLEQALQVVVNPNDLCPWEGEPQAHWLALFDVEGSEVFLVEWHKFMQLAATPGMANGMAECVLLDGGWGAVRMQLGWVRTALAQRSAVLGDTTGPESFLGARAVERAQPEDFVHLHNHSVYSLLDGASSIEGMVHRARLNGQRAIALTDHGYCFGTFKFYNECKKQGIKPILGCELYVVDDVSQRYKDAGGNDRRWEYHQTVLAMNQTGWKNLCRLLTKACRDHFYHVPRVDHRMLFEHGEGLIVLSGCFKGMAAWHLQDHRYEREVLDDEGKPTGQVEKVDPSVDRPWVKRDPDRSRQIMRAYKQCFGDRYYVELHNHDYRRHMAAMPELVQMAREEGILTVLACDAHYEVIEDAVVQALMTRISSSRVDEIGMDLMQGRGPYYLRTREEMRRAYLPDADVSWITDDMLDRTCEIADRCDVSLDFEGYLFPDYKVEEDVDWPAFRQSQSSQVRPAAFARARVGDPQTSHEAAVTLKERLNADIQFAVECVRRSPGMTSRELDDLYCPEDHGRVRKRLKEAEELGLIRRQEKGKQNPATGRWADIWWPVENV